MSEKKASEAKESTEESSPVEGAPSHESDEASESLDVAGYFARLEQGWDAHPDGAWVGSEAHQEAFEALLETGVEDPTYLQQLLTGEPRLALRYEALRLVAHLEQREWFEPVLDGLLERAGYYPLMGRRLRALRSMWREDPRPTSSIPLPPEIEGHRMDICRELWFGPPRPDAGLLQASLEALAALGEPGLYGIDCVLREVLEEGRLMAQGRLEIFVRAADIFVEHRYFEGVQVFFDFLADCRPIKPGPMAKKTVGGVLKAVRKLRPYRYPQWALPLQKFVEYYRSIKRMGRAAEANMLIILITASSLDEALLLEDDELVDLLRGRRDAAYTEEDFEAVAALCDAVLEADRCDCRIYHIRGWVAARLEGAEAAESFFQMAIQEKPDYVYSHLALASIYEMWGEDELQDRHLAAACDAEPSLISSQRKYGEHLERDGFIEEAAHYYKRGTQLTPEAASVLELEEFFGCHAALAQLLAANDELPDALSLLDQLTPEQVFERFGARFTRRQKIIIELLQKGLHDFRAELVRNAQEQIGA